MKKLLLAAMGTMFFATLASATNVTYVVGTCNSFSGAGNNIASPWVCPTAASLGVGAGTTLVTEFVNYLADYSSGTAPTVVLTTNWTFSPGGATQFSSDTTTTSGGSTSTSQTSADGLALNAFCASCSFTYLGNSYTGSGTILAGFYNNITSVPTQISVTYSDAITQGSALGTTGYAQVVYGYTVDQVGTTPEPSSLLMLGSALVGLGAMKFRKRK